MLNRSSAPVPLGAGDQTDLAAHFRRQHASLDALGVPLFSALSAPAEAGESEAADLASRLTLPLSAPGWRRVWVARPDGGLIAAHLVLRGADLVPALHRARVSLGVEPGFQRQGLGESLLRAAIAFAADSGLAWLELWVFGHNAAAIALYRKLGFAEAGRTVDQFRVGGQSIDDLTMTLALRL